MLLMAKRDNCVEYIADVEIAKHPQIIGIAFIRYLLK